MRLLPDFINYTSYINGEETPQKEETKEASSYDFHDFFGELSQYQKKKRGYPGFETEKNVRQETVKVPSKPEPAPFKEERQAAEVVEKAYSEAGEILEAARNEAEALKQEAEKKGYEAGYSQGFQQGVSTGHAAGSREIKEKYNLLLADVDHAVHSIDTIKKERLDLWLEEMKDVVLAIAQKVIRISLESSGEVILNMISAAIEPGRDKQWAKVYISASDAAVMEEDGIDPHRELRNISDRIKIEILEDADSGTCIVEFPDQMIDAGVNTQLYNIREAARQFEPKSETSQRTPEQENSFVL